MQMGVSLPSLIRCLVRRRGVKGQHPHYIQTDTSHRLGGRYLEGGLPTCSGPICKYGNCKKNFGETPYPPSAVASVCTRDTLLTGAANKLNIVFSPACRRRASVDGPTRARLTCEIQMRKSVFLRGGRELPPSPPWSVGPRREGAREAACPVPKKSANRRCRTLQSQCVAHSHNSHYQVNF